MQDMPPPHLQAMDLPSKTSSSCQVVAHINYKPRIYIASEFDFETGYGSWLVGLEPLHLRHILEMPKNNVAWWMKSYNYKCMATTTTWSDIVRCADILTQENDDVFTPLHRKEGGFACGVDETQGGVTKSIRFRDFMGQGLMKRWPSFNSNFDMAEDDLTVFQGGDLVLLTCQGTHCAPIPQDKFESYAKTICETLGWYMFKKKHELGSCEKVEEKWLQANRDTFKRKRSSVADQKYDVFKQLSTLDSIN